MSLLVCIYLSLNVQFWPSVHERKSKINSCAPNSFLFFESLKFNQKFKTVQCTPNSSKKSWKIPNDHNHDEKMEIFFDHNRIAYDNRYFPKKETSETESSKKWKQHKYHISIKLFIKYKIRSRHVSTIWKKWRISLYNNVWSCMWWIVWIPLTLLLGHGTVCCSLQVYAGVTEW